MPRACQGSSWLFGSNLFYTVAAESGVEANKGESKRISVGTEGRLKPERAWGDEPVATTQRLWVISGMVLSIFAPLVSNLGS
jgi:hypothetical protein